MSDFNNQSNMEEKEDQNDIRARHLFVINESQAGLDQPLGETPASIHKRYNFDKHFMGRGQTIVIVSAYYYPTALADFNTFSKQFGLPLESSPNPLAATNKVFQVIYARGTQPVVDAGWAIESALDIQWAHAMAPLAKIVTLPRIDGHRENLYNKSWRGSQWDEGRNMTKHLRSK